MADIKTEKMDLEPHFDMELFMATSQETRIGGEVMERMSQLWDEWVPYAHAVKIEVKGDSYMLVWLDEEVEDLIDKAWDETPSEAFRNNALAQVMCMSMIHSALPQVEAVGCAPAPKPNFELGKALKELGIPYSQSPVQNLERRYAVLTHYPFKGGCEICDLIKACPKAAGDNTTITLPGHEE